ncbi:hypothetical protein QWJ34_23405 [Saccharibacillus sp. CPCC 101409]|uniref:hypothetical protein n=1 Tax=Saccharibacillus sp. CPCC 101409 TaxID=3058041 RepID=UPI002673AB2F|nr:hypothetical protein [Saccharibacillus sp. CPCC 101409]MDO3412734.1 hypothetical protein [Saccharibacillus sp. CPCC 101409]
MTGSVKNTFTTIRNLLTLRNLLAVLCAAALVAVVVKGFRIEAKIRQVETADEYYADNRRIQAEEAYAEALSNTVIRYREEHVRARLTELEPITRLRKELLKSKSELLAAVQTGGFDAFVSAYETYDTFGRLSLDGDYAAEYRELLKRYGLDETAKKGFADFRARFEQSLSANLDSGNYGDESAKWNLLRIPAAFFAGDAADDDADTAAKKAESADAGSEDAGADAAEAVKSSYLSGLFQRYDERKLQKLAAAGRFADMLNEALATLQAYRPYNFDAPWLQKQTESTMEALLRKDLAGEAYAAFAGHARSFGDFLTSASLDSHLVRWIDRMYLSLMSRAAASVSAGRFEEAIDLYTALNAYTDTSKQIEETETAWTAAEPVRILQQADGSHTYSNVVSGRNRFGADVYVAALDETGRLYFGTLNGAATAVVSDPQFLAIEKVRSLTIDEDLSTDTVPVIVADAESASRKAVYTGLLLRSGSFTEMFRIEADGYAISDGGQTLRAVHPLDAEEDGETAVYTRSGDLFEFAEWEGGTADIGSGSPDDYPQEKVRTRLNVIETGSGRALARTMDGEPILLRGNFDFAPGTYEVTGTFRGRYEQVEDPDAENASDSGGAADDADDSAASPGTESGAAEELESGGDTTLPPEDSADDADDESGAGGSDGADRSNSPEPGSPDDSLAPDGSDSAGAETEPGEQPAPEAPAVPEPVMRSVPVFEVEAVESAY